MKPGGNTLKIVAAILSICAAAVQAHPMSAEECQYFASDAALDVRDRDAGVTLKEQIEEAATGLPACRAKFPQCIYKDDEDTDRVMRLLTWVYSPAAKNMTPQDTYETMLDACTRAGKAVLPNGIHPTGPQIGA